MFVWKIRKFGFKPQSLQQLQDLLAIDNSIHSDKVFEFLDQVPGDSVKLELNFILNKAEESGAKTITSYLSQVKFNLRNRNYSETDFSASLKQLYSFPPSFSSRLYQELTKIKTLRGEKNVSCVDFLILLLKFRDEIELSLNVKSSNKEIKGDIVDVIQNLVEGKKVSLNEVLSVFKSNNEI